MPIRRLLALLWLAASAAAPAIAAQSVFDSHPDWPVAFAPRLKPAAADRSVLRVLTVEERVGEPRSEELVRVPLFLHEDEPNTPEQWTLFEESDTAHRHPLVFQVDDRRHSDTGRLTRCHLYFSVTLAAWERRTFHLVSRDPQAAPPPAAVEKVVCTDTDGRITLAGRDLAVAFLATGPRAGALAAIRVGRHDLHLPDGWLAPELTLVRQSADCTTLRRSRLSYADPGSLEVREVRWGSGPLFAKFSVRIGPPGLPDAAEFSYRIPARGAVVLQTERLAPEGPPDEDVVGAENHAVLSGALRLGPGAAPPKLVRVPAGLRHATRRTNGHFLEAVVDPEAGIALLPVPGVQTGGVSATITPAGIVHLPGPPSFQRHPASRSGSLRAFWGETRFAFAPRTDPEALWHLARAQFQPLVAVVDEPGFGVADFRAAMPTVAQRFREIKSWSRNWPQDAAILWLAREREGFAALLARKPAAPETVPDFHKPAWARATPPRPRDPKDQGRIDPYHLSYGSSTIPLYHRIAPAPRLPATARAIAQASREVFGRVNSAGFPRVDCFASAFNMQLGPLGLALFGGRETDDPTLARWALDALHAPGVTGIYGHGQRPYPGEIGRAEASDFLYQSISDFHLRAIELATGEDLRVHPAALARYFDCVDVTADLQHRSLTANDGWSRANFFRGQAHDHRWEAWSCAPFAGVFARAADRGRIGITEACYWIERQSYLRQAWAELLWYAHADLLLETADRLPPPRTGPPLPQGLAVDRTGAGNRLRWSATPGAAGYRIYRSAEQGGPWIWLNSPYDNTPDPSGADTSFDDPAGSAGDVYLVTAHDPEGRESRWDPDEPPPR